MKVVGGIKGLEIFSGYYAPEKRELSKLEVLKPVDIKLSGDIATNGNQTIDAHVGDFRFKVTPAVIRLLSAVAAGMSVKPAEVRFANLAFSPPLTYGDFFRPAPVRQRKRRSCESDPTSGSRKS